MYHQQAGIPLGRQQSMQELSPEKINCIVRDSFGLWLTGLLSAIGGHNPDISFDAQREQFFMLIEYLLHKGTIKFIAPNADCYISPDNPNPRFTIYDADAYWNISPREIVSFLRQNWPSKALSENDTTLLLYLYEMPAVVWFDEKGEPVAS